MSHSLGELKEFLREKAARGVALAYSGGVDSTLLLSVQKELCDEEGVPFVAIMARSVFQSSEEVRGAVATAESLGVSPVLLEFDPLTIPELRGNPPDRCYWCKRHILSLLAEAARRHGAALLVEGTNADDLQAYRPGLKALAESNALSPLAELGLSKQDVRRLSEERGLATARKPSTPCLATRFDYGTQLTAGLIEMVAQGEEYLRGLLPDGTQLRLRVHGDIARVEVAESAQEAILAHAREISRKLHALGFRFATLDLEPYRSGCYDPPPKSI